MGLAAKEECKESEMGKKLLPVLQHRVCKKLTDDLQLQYGSLDSALLCVQASLQRETNKQALGAGLLSDDPLRLITANNETARLNQGN